jgi:hypothetical protein
VGSPFLIDRVFTALIEDIDTIPSLFGRFGTVCRNSCNQINRMGCSAGSTIVSALTVSSTLRWPTCSEMRDTLSRVIEYFDSVHAGHTLDGNEAEEDFALCVRSDSGEAPIDWFSFAPRLFVYIEIP